MTTVLEAPLTRRQGRSSSCMQKLERLEWAVEAWFEIGPSKLAIRTTSPVFADWLTWVLAEYRVDEPDDDHEYTLYSMVIEDGSRGVDRVGRRFHILYHGTWDKVRTMDIEVIGRAILEEAMKPLFYDSTDRLYLNASVLSNGHANVLVPPRFVPVLAKAGRRAQREGLILPGCSYSAIDPLSAELVPVDPGLRTPADALDHLVSAFPSGLSSSDPRTFVDASTAVDTVILEVGIPLESQVHPLTRAYTATTLATTSFNVGKVGRQAIETLGSLVARANCLTIGWSTTQELLTGLRDLPPAVGAG